MKPSDLLQSIPNDAYTNNFFLRDKLFRDISAVMIIIFGCSFAIACFISQSLSVLLVPILPLSIFSASLFFTYRKYKNGVVDFSNGSFPKSEITQSKFDFLQKWNYRQYMIRMGLGPVSMLFPIIFVFAFKVTFILLPIGAGCTAGALYAANCFYKQNERDLKNAYRIVPDAPKPPRESPDEDDPYSGGSYKDFFKNPFKK